MSIGSIASSIWSAATTALTSPTPATAPVSPPSTNPNGSTAANGTTGTTNPFQALSSDLQAWLTQNQAAGAAGQTAPNQANGHHHHHHHGGNTNPSQQDPFPAMQSYNAASALPGVQNTQPAAA